METYRFTTCPSPVGRLTLASDGENLVGLWLEGQKYFGQPLLPGACVQDGGLAVFRAARQWLDAYFAGEQPCPGALPLRPAGSAFRQQVWALLCRIPYGATTTYGALAARLAAQMGRPSMSSQAVGGAVGHNPISIIIPCHRVVGSHGSLTGYAGGLAAKAAAGARGRGHAPAAHAPNRHGAVGARRAERAAHRRPAAENAPRKAAPGARGQGAGGTGLPAGKGRGGLFGRKPGPVCPAAGPARPVFMKMEKTGGSKRKQEKLKENLKIWPEKMRKNTGKSGKTENFAQIFRKKH